MAWYHWRDWNKPVRWTVVSGALVFILGLLIVGAGVGTFYYMDARLKDEVADFLVVDSKDQDGYDDWEHNNYPDAVPIWNDYYMWNLTNIAETLAGTAKPAYELIGPFSYRMFTKKINVAFLDGGNQVSYSEWNYYTFEPQYSVSDPKTTYTTNFNGAYMSVLRTAGSESALMTGMTAPTLKTVVGLLTSPLFLMILSQQTTASTLPHLQIQTIRAIETKYNLTTQEATTVFYSDWANATSPDPEIWSTLGVLSTNATGPSNMSVQSVVSLWTDTTLPSMINTDPTQVFVWFSAGLGDPTARAGIAAAFGIDQSQLAKVLSWQAKLQNTVIKPAVLAQFNVSSAEDLGYLQWGTGSPTRFVSVRDLDPSNPLNLAGIPEAGIWSNQSLAFDATTSKRLLADPSSGLLNTTNLVTFLTLVQRGDATTIKALWDLDMPEAVKLASYFMYIGSTFVKTALEGAFNPKNTSNFLGGGGLISTRTVDEWLFGFEDPLLKLLQVPKTNVEYVHNQTTEDQAYAEKNDSTFYTGKDNLDDISYYIKWQGLSELAAGNPWGDVEKVEGYYGTNFQPFLHRDDRVDAWIEELLRNVILKYTSQVDKYDITLYRYRLSKEDFEQDPKFYQGIFGFANMTSSLGAPLLISKSRMLDTPAEWRDKLSGVVPDDDDDTYLDIEPITGHVMDVEKKLQLNLYLDNSSTLDVFNVGVPKDVIYPLFYTDQNSEITEELADDFKDSVYKFMTLQKAALWTGVAVGCALVLVAFIAFVVAGWLYRRSRASYYGIPDTANPDAAPEDYFEPHSPRRASIYT